MNEIKAETFVTADGVPLDVRESNFFIGTALKQYEAYGRYMIFGKGKYYTEQGLFMDEVVGIAPTTLTFINTDPLKGELIAVYTADFLKAPNKSADYYEVIALSHTKEVIPMTAVCYVGEQKGRISGKVSFTVKITMNSEFMAFVGGTPNPLVNFLLGNGYGISKYTSRHGNIDYPNVPIVRNEQNTGEDFSATLHMEETGMTFRTALLGSQDSEILLLADGKPVIRVLPYETQSKTETIALSANGAGYILLNKNSAFSISSLVQNGNSITDGKIVNLPFKIGLMKELLPFKVSAGTKIISDTLSEFLGFVTENEIIVVKLDIVRGTKMMFRRCHQNAYVTILAGGTILISQKEKTDVFYYDASNNKYEEVNFNVGKGEQTVAVMEINTIHFAKIENGKLKRFKLNKGEKPIDLGEKSVGSLGKLFRDHTHIIYAENSGAAICCNSIGEDKEREATIGTYFFDLGTPVEWQAEEGCIYMKTSDIILLGYTFVFDGSEIEVGENPQLFGNVLVSKKGENYSFFFCDHVHATMPECLIPAEKELKNALRVGDHLVLLFSDGSLSTYYIFHGAQAIYSPHLKGATATISFKYRERFLGGKAFSCFIKLLFTRSKRH